MPHVRSFAVLLILAVATISLAAEDRADAAMATIRPEAIRAGMRFLSDDALEGRGTGSRGYDVAAKFMASQFEAMGLRPAGDKGSFFQTVPLRRMKTDEGKSSFTVVRDGKEEAYAFRSDYILSSDPGRPDSSVEAKVVFVGFGITAPGQNYDDYKGIDAKGKIVAYLFGAPDFESSLKAHYSSSTVKAQNAVNHGAVGAIVLNSPTLEQVYSFSKRVRDLSIPRYKWLDAQEKPNDYFPQLKGGVSLSMDGTRKLLEGSPHSPEEIFAAAKAGKPVAFELPVSVKIRTVTESTDIRSANIVALLEGSDPTLKSQYLVYTSHLDHLGIADPVNGDSIYNGAVDNSSGSTILLEMARAFSKLNPAPRRSVLFVSVTAEEAGLLGSDYFAQNPTVPKASIAANINVDQALMLWPLKDIVAFGAEHSSLGTVIQKAAARMQLVQSPDPVPQQVVFIRSDQYSFVKQGIPAVMPSPGFQSADPKINAPQVMEEWLRTRYHQPQDDMDQPGLNFEAAARFAQFAFLCGYLVTEDTERPTWNKGDFFGDLYANRH